MYETVPDIWVKLMRAKRDLAEIKSSAKRLAREIGRGVMVERDRFKMLHNIAESARKNIGEAVRVARENNLTPLVKALDPVLKEATYLTLDTMSALNDYVLIKTRPDLMARSLEFVSARADIVSGPVSHVLKILELQMESLKEAHERLSRKK